MGGGMGHGGMGGFGRAAIAGPSSFGHVTAVRPMGFDRGRFAFRDHDRFAFRDRDRFHHRFFRNRFAFFGAAYPYGYYDNCYTRVWTQWGWRWQNVCY